MSPFALSLSWRRFLIRCGEELVHLLHLELDWIVREDLIVLTFGLVHLCKGSERDGDRERDLAEIGRELERVDAASVVANDEDRVFLVEADVSEFGSFDHFLFAERLMFIDREIEDMHL
jgi:hypothetical protein